MDLTALSDEALNQHFMPRIAVPDHETWLNDDLAASTRVRQDLASQGRGELDRRYGPGPRQLLDLFPAREPNAPVIVWMHGGYWRALSKEHYTNIAPPLLYAGAAVALVGYDLCPNATLAGLLAQTRAALQWVRAHAAEMRGDPNRIIVAGNSAGAHICAMALQHEWAGSDFPASGIRAAALITGIYDLAPVPLLPVQLEVRLRPADIAALSPQLLPIRNKARCLVAVGGDEPSLWIEQSRNYHAKLVAAEVQSELMIVPNRHHFSITRDLADAASPLSRAVGNLLNS
ncbi:alpha/beta hydrolase [Dongia sp.]|uniref:alpha/beta hydrolase n=1 Tax=Dongia sp. TaxID=1977262 RepID=UPI0035ADFE64